MLVHDEEEEDKKHKWTHLLEDCLGFSKQLTAWINTHFEKLI
ncbi:MAG: hypothetical protein OXB99_16170 [Acidimicrobiaceae bacterium]|nr:hypothetical protein [Acidimicrobiaceae bacterium]